jgi:hypothetical protein
MATTYSQIGSTVTVDAGGSATISFSSIPSTYTDLVLKVSARYSAAGPFDTRLTFNGNTSAVYAMKSVNGAGSGVPGSASESAGVSTWFGAVQGVTASTFNNVELYIPDYTSTTMAKSVSTEHVNEANQVDARGYLITQLWNPGTQAAITSLSISVSSGTFAQYSTATLYGIKKN